jgi:hypothetical protein
MNGYLFNTVLTARSLEVSRPTAVSRVMQLQQMGLVRLLPFFGGHRRPLFFVCDSYGAGPASFRAFCLEAVTRALLTIDPQFQFFWWMTGRTRRMDLLAVCGERRIGFCFSTTPCLPRKDWLPLSIGRERKLIERGFVLYRGNRAFWSGRAIQTLPIEEFLREPREWTFGRRTAHEASPAMCRINNKAARSQAQRVGV